jgi:hypothetical protein
MKQRRPLCKRSKAGVTVHTDYDGKFRFVQCQRLGPDRGCTVSDTTCLFWDDCGNYRMKGETDDPYNSGRKFS